MQGRKLHRGLALIEVAEPLLLTEIESDPGLRPHLGERLSERCIAVRPQAAAEVLRRLQALGHMPRLVEGAAPPGGRQKGNGAALQH